MWNGKIFKFWWVLKMYIVCQRSIQSKKWFINMWTLCNDYLSRSRIKTKHWVQTMSHWMESTKHREIVLYRSGVFKTQQLQRQPVFEQYTHQSKRLLMCSMPRRWFVRRSNYPKWGACYVWVVQMLQQFIKVWTVFLFGFLFGRGKSIVWTQICRWKRQRPSDDQSQRILFDALPQS